MQIQIKGRSMGRCLIALGMMLAFTVSFSARRVGAAPPELTSTPTQTSTPTATPTFTPIPDSLQNFEGDRVIFSQNIPVTVKDGLNPPKSRMLRAGTQLLGLGKPRDGKYSFVVTKCSPYVGLFDLEPEKRSCSGTPLFSACSGCKVLLKEGGDITSEDDPVALGTVLEVDASEMSGDKKPSRYGFAFGTLVAPFKFQLTGDHDLTGSATIGPFLGYRLQNQFYGIAVTPALFAGASNLPVGKADGDTKQVLGFSYGGALLLDVKSAFQAGAILGWDRTGDSEGYEYNNKPWIGVQIGYSFTKTTE